MQAERNGKVAEFRCEHAIPLDDAALTYGKHRRRPLRIGRFRPGPREHVDGEVQEGYWLAGAYHYLIALQKYAAHSGSQALGILRWERIEDAVAENQAVRLRRAPAIWLVW